MKRVAIIQSNYIPWKGYFDIINHVDTFYFEDDLQYTVRDWRNRNQMKTADGKKWLTVPVLGGRDQKISEVKIDYSLHWIRKHCESLKRAYAKSNHLEPWLGEYRNLLELKVPTLSELNVSLITWMCRRLNITTQLIPSSEVLSAGTKDDKLIDILKTLGATHYVTGPAAQNYIVEDKFKQAGITLEYFDYSGYPEYEQPHPPFDHQVSILDLVFNVGSKAPDYIWGWRETKKMVEK
jgi:hypothetical protein